MQKLNMNVNNSRHLALHIIDSKVKVLPGSIQIKANNTQDEELVSKMMNDGQVGQELKNKFVEFL